VNLLSIIEQPREAVESRNSMSKLSRTLLTEIAWIEQTFKNNILLVVLLSN
jgi:hypothetical protein